MEGRQIVTKVLQNSPETHAPCNNFVTISFLVQPAQKCCFFLYSFNKIHKKPKNHEKNQKKGLAIRHILWYYITVLGREGTREGRKPREYLDNRIHAKHKKHLKKGFICVQVIKVGHLAGTCKQWKKL